jgi:hypothetical protein
MNDGSADDPNVPAERPVIGVIDIAFDH